VTLKDKVALRSWFAKLDEDGKTYELSIAFIFIFIFYFCFCFYFLREKI